MKTYWIANSVVFAISCGLALARCIISSPKLLLVPPTQVDIPDRPCIASGYVIRYSATLYAKLLFLAALFVSPLALAEAEVISFGPTPYRSAADSPFADYLDEPDFYLEDFEDGELNTPGVSTVGSTFSPAAEIRGGVPEVDSVDTGPQYSLFGHSLQSRTHLTLFRSPPLQQLVIDFRFDREAIGFFPNAFGFVWTDGAPSSGIAILATLVGGEETPLLTYAGIGDDTRESSTADDVFIGFTGIGFERIRLIGGYTGDAPAFDYFEIDHLQYGRLRTVPAPSTIGLTIACSWLFFLRGTQRPVSEVSAARGTLAR